MTFLAAARDLPQNVITANKPRSGRPPKTSKHTDGVRSQELHRKHHLSASELNEMHQDHIGNVSIRCIKQRLKRDLMIPSHRSASKTLLIARNRKRRLQITLRYLSEVLMIRKRSCGLMNTPFNASPATNIGHFSAKMDT